MAVGSVEVRTGGPADAGALADLRFAWRAGERGEQGLDESRFAEALTTWMDEHRSTHLPSLAVRDGRPVPVGMAWLAIVDRVPGPGRFLRRSGNVQSLYVVPAERGNGVGTALMEALLAESRRLGLDYLTAHPSQRALPLYRRLGFAETDQILELR
jgi:GNAT superfamily N-acetyltransferase